MFFFGLLSALAHKPSFGDSYVSAETAYIVSDPDISIVVYQELTCEQPELWLQFDAPDNFELYVQLGVPVIDWLDGYQPMVAVIAEAYLMLRVSPFDSEGMGAIVYQPAANPDNFASHSPKQIGMGRGAPQRFWRRLYRRLASRRYDGKIWLATGETEGLLMSLYRILLTGQRLLTL